MFRGGKFSQTRLCSQRIATLALAVSYSKHTPIIEIFSPLRTPSDHSEILTHREESWQNKCESKRIKLTCSNVKHLTSNPANGTPEFSENPAWHKTQLLFRAQSVQGAHGTWYKKSEVNQVWRWTELVPSPRTTSGAGTKLLGWGAKGKMEGHRARSACTFWCTHWTSLCVNCVLLMPWKPSERAAQQHNFPRRASWA